jgi:PAS domain S-box-containing protein
MSMQGEEMPSQMTNFEGLLETAPDALVGVDQEGVIRFVNRQTESLFGYEREDLVGQPVEILMPESLRAVHRVYRQGYGQHAKDRAMGTGLKLRGRRRDGTQFHVDIALSPIDSGDGLFVIAVVRDKSGWEKTGEDRYRSDLLGAIVEHSDDAIIGKTLDGIIRSWNPAAERMYGYSRDEVIGKSIDILGSNDRTGEMHAILAMISAGEPVSHLETIRVRKDGTTLTVSLTVSPIRDAHDAIIGASTIARDMTEQRQAFEAARSMIEASLDSLVAISPEGRITDVNEATVKVTGVSRDQLMGTAFSDYFTEPEKANAIYQRVFEQGMAVDCPLTLRHRDGTLTEVLYNASVYRDPAGNVLGVFAAARDVTKLMQAQREIAEQRAQELDRLEELERFHRLTVGRELKMIQLKKQNEYLSRHGTAEQDESDHEL